MGTLFRVASFNGSTLLHIRILIGYRITVNRREYQGSTPYTDAERDVFTQGSDDQRLDLLLSEGKNLALCLEGLIHSLSLPPRVVIFGWSLGKLFTLPLLASISSLPQAVQERLASSVHKTIVWVLRYAGSPTYVPLLDLDIAPEARPMAFLKWLGYYIMHGGLFKRNITRFDKGYSDPNRRGTFNCLPLQELAEMIDLNASSRSDSLIPDASLGQPGFLKVAGIITNKALFDTLTPSAWGGMDVWHLFGNSNIPQIMAATWFLEDQVHCQPYAI
ncbi:hypothetical protein BT96DRAFT_997589 [Gymnopus androsaceus JB14]|uniref:AB hydrolase-1 domain-containing protein n=1 Tax=Gymnopus androsaceus JB14 TaxID=1447944 RepID=A0A6A4HE90_9AGAR|nr:hypothetical protein BT96DRAFT_997589 [Gymnopus androsaceus JB14]